MDKSHKFQIGIIVDAGPVLGYGHVVRCLRLANALAQDAAIIFYPLSESCREFLISKAVNPAFAIRNSYEIDSLPPLVITDLHEAHGITAAIQRQRSRQSSHSAALHSRLAVERCGAGACA